MEILGESSDEPGDADVSDLEERSTDVSESQEADEIEGSPGRNPDKDGLASTVMESEEDSVELGSAVLDSVNNGSGPFTPELVMEKFVSDFRQAEKLYGETLIRQLTGYDSSYVSKNMNIPEFKRHLTERIKQNIADLQKDGLLSRQGDFTQKAVDLASVSLVVSELDKLTGLGLVGPREQKRRLDVASHNEIKRFSGESYRNIAVSASVRTALRRGHTSFSRDDLRVFDPSGKGRSEIIYAIDTSGSMKGNKVAAAKRAGVALSYQAISSGDKVGLVTFGKVVSARISPSRNFHQLLDVLTRVRAGSETDLASGISASCELFSKNTSDSKHLLILTDALPTVGSNPTAEVLEAVGVARSLGVTVSVIGLGLDDEGSSLATQVAQMGRGRVLLPADVKDLDVLVLTEYLSFS